MRGGRPRSANAFVGEGHRKREEGRGKKDRDRDRDIGVRQRHFPAVFLLVLARRPSDQAKPTVRRAGGVWRKSASGSVRRRDRIDIRQFGPMRIFEVGHGEQ